MLRSRYIIINRFKKSLTGYHRITYYSCVSRYLIPAHGMKTRAVSATPIFTTTFLISLRWHRGLWLRSSAKSFCRGGQGMSVFSSPFWHVHWYYLSKVFGKHSIAVTTVSRPNSSVAKLAAQRAAREFASQQWTGHQAITVSKPALLYII